MTGPTLPIRVTALYRFARFADPQALCAPLAALCDLAGLRGTLLIAHEGINGTIAGSDDAVDEVLAHIQTLPDCRDLEVKHSRAATMPFHRMKVRVKDEIVTMGEPHVDPLGDVGHYVAPEDWNALIAAPGTILIDTRNDYEVAIGSFDGAISPDTKTFRDFPAWVRQQRDLLGAAPRVAMFCTGGIRCEKATAFLKSEGLDEVYHLKGGILKYLETVPRAESRWQGECFVFDERVAVTHGLGQGSHMLCRGCRMPLNPEARASPLYVEGVSCPACHDSRDERQRLASAERHRQTLLAASRGEVHIGARPKRGA